MEKVDEKRFNSSVDFPSTVDSPYLAKNYESSNHWRGRIVQNLVVVIGCTASCGIVNSLRGQGAVKGAYGAGIGLGFSIMGLAINDYIYFKNQRKPTFCPIATLIASFGAGAVIFGKTSWYEEKTIQLACQAIDGLAVGALATLTLYFGCRFLNDIKN